MRVLIIRLIAWLCDFLLALVAFNYLLSFETLSAQFNNLSYSLVEFGLSQVSSNLTSTFVLTYFITIVFRFYFTIIFGKSFSQIIFRFQTDSSFLWARLGGGLRCTLEIFIPFTVTDFFFLIKRKKTLKEQFTACSLSLKDSYFQVFSTLFYFPICILIAVSSPMFYQLTFIDGIKLGFSKELLEPIDNRTDFSKFKHYPSETFKMSSFSSIKDSKIKLVPSFEISREKSKKRIRPYLVIHDMERKVFGELKLKKRFSLKRVIRLVSDFDPFFSTFYPELSKVSKRPRDHYSVIKYKDKYGDKKVLNPLARKELRELIQSSFELSYKNLFSHIVSRGPFLTGHIRVRNYLYSLVDSEVDSTVDLVKLGNYNFLRFKQSFESLEAIEKGMSESYIPIETLNSAVLQLNWGNSRKDAFARNDFKEKFLNSSKWFFDYKGIFQPPKKAEDFTFFTIMDFFTLKNLDQKFVDSLHRYSFGYYFEMGKLSLRKNNVNLQDSVIASCNRILLLISYKKREVRNQKETRKFVRMISDLKNAIKTKNREYFEN